MVHDRQISKTLSYWLRHRPEVAGLELDGSGWTSVDEVLLALGSNVDRRRLQEVVESNDKQRFELSEDGSRIRARQGHSVGVQLGWPRVAPPELLFHGTVARALPLILAEGLKPMKRHHVHLSPDEATARAVGSRRGESVVLKVKAAELADSGEAFFLTANSVWLVARVPPEFLLTT